MVSFGEFSLNLATREMYHNEESIALTSGEFAVLKVLVTHQGAFVPRQADESGPWP